jgi:hypothetical protein
MINELKNTKMKTYKATTCQWRVNGMKALNLEYTIVNNMIVYKGSIGQYKTLVDMLVTECNKLGLIDK